MTVKELIEILEKCTDKNMDVLLVYHTNIENEHDIKKVFTGKKYVYIQNWDANS